VILHAYASQLTSLASALTATHQADWSTKNAQVSMGTLSAVQHANHDKQDFA